ncbi:hypothetical protein WA158_006530 [Blastocystis sp. Blastoise]
MTPQGRRVLYFSICGFFLVAQVVLFTYFNIHSPKELITQSFVRSPTVNYTQICKAQRRSRYAFMDDKLSRDERKNSFLVTSLLEDQMTLFAQNRSAGEHLIIVFEKGQYVVNPFNLTSYTTLCILPYAELSATTDINNYPLIHWLPSYGQGREMPGPRYHNIIELYNVTDAHITGGGSINGQGLFWWLQFQNKQLMYTRPHIIEVAYSNNIHISDISLFCSPFWTVHLYTSSYIYMTSVSIYNPTTEYLPTKGRFYQRSFYDFNKALGVPKKLQYLYSMQKIIKNMLDSMNKDHLEGRRDERLAPNTDGVVPDSCQYVYLNNLHIESGDDCIAIKSGWDDIGLDYNTPSTHIYIQQLQCIAPFRSAIAIGSETSGGISDVVCNHIDVVDAVRALGIKLALGRGGHVHDISYKDIQVQTAKYLFVIYSKHNQRRTGYTGTILPLLDHVSLQNATGTITNTPGLLEGFEDSDWHASDIRIEDIHLETSEPWVCRNITLSSYVNVNIHTIQSCI